jgi:hypothetical protein
VAWGRERELAAGRCRAGESLFPVAECDLGEVVSVSGEEPRRRVRREAAEGGVDMRMQVEPTGRVLEHEVADGEDRSANERSELREKRRILRGRRGADERDYGVGRASADGFEAPYRRQTLDDPVDQIHLESLGEPAAQEYEIDRRVNVVRLRHLAAEVIAKVEARTGRIEEED